MGTRTDEMRFTLIGVLLLCIIAIQAHAATITVTHTHDSGPGSLRQALADANDGDTINFAVTGSITLTSGKLVIDKNVTIQGPGAGQLSINGNQTYWIELDYTTATISGLTIRNCLVGIYNDHGALTVNNCVISGNSFYGLGVDGSSGGPEVERGYDRPSAKQIPVGCSFAIACLTIANSIISGNFGSGVYNLSAFVTIDNSTITGNSEGPDYGYGGGIDSEGHKLPGNVVVSNSTISGNSALYAGGGIACGFSGLTVINSTISGNSGGESGGGIASDFGVSIVNSTISGNSAGSGGGIYNFGVLEISNTILNAGASGENIVNNGGAVTSHGYNISSDDGAGLLNGPGDQINTDPLLSPLRNHGGPTLTHLPLRRSPAIDAGDPNFTPPPDHDQRGSCFYRVFGGRIDVGSVETQRRPPCVTPAPRPTP